MRIFKFFLISCFLVTTISKAQSKDISLEDIWDGSFRTERMDALHSMKNGNQYSVLNFDREVRSTAIDVYDYKTLSKVRTLVSSTDIEEIPYFTDYTFSEDENKILLATEEEPIFRRSTLGKYYVYNVSEKSLHNIADYKIQEPTFSPNGKYVAYGYNNNLYVKNLETNDLIQLTTDGKKNEIINGITDWVYEEEFGFVRAFEWNSDSDRIAFIRFDETNVPEFSMDIMGNELYPTQQVFKYPKAGEKNAEVSLHIYDLETNQTTQVDLFSFNNYYIPRIKWTKDKSLLSVQLLNRHQNELDLILVDVSNNNSTSLLHREKDVAYVAINDDLTFLDNKKRFPFAFFSGKPGLLRVKYHEPQSTLGLTQSDVSSTSDRFRNLILEDLS